MVIKSASDFEKEKDQFISKFRDRAEQVVRELEREKSALDSHGLSIHYDSEKLSLSLNYRSYTAIQSIIAQDGSNVVLLNDYITDGVNSLKQQKVSDANYGVSWFQMSVEPTVNVFVKSNIKSILEALGI